MEQFKKAFAWMQKVQEACLFTPGISVDLERQFTPNNHTKDSIHGFSCRLRIYEHASKTSYIAEYTPWYGLEGKMGVEAYLSSIEIHISEGISGLSESEIDDLRESVVFYIGAIADARDTTEGLNMPKAVALYDKEIKKYNDILAKLV